MDSRAQVCDRFKEEFKYFKSKCTKPDLSRVIDFDRAAYFDDIICNIRLSDNGDKSTSAINNPCEECQYLGLQDHCKWQIFSLRSKPGFFLIRNPFKVHGQQKWIRNSLEKYSRKPNRTNLDALYESVNEVWSAQWWTDEEKQSRLLKLRWSTLGYHHDWNTKIYHLDDYSNFPLCLSRLCRHTASVLGFSNFHPEAAIINYYRLDSTLGGHIDHSEYAYEAPILSFSFGQTAVFLIGTENKSDRPMSLFIRSGDIVIMSGLCRLAYHGMPLVLKDSVEERYSSKVLDDTWTPFSKYLSTSRINFNARQVFSYS